MRTYDTKIQEIKGSVLREVAGLAFEGRLSSGILDIPQKLFPGPNATLRCCIFKEQAIVGERIKLALGGNHENQNIIEVLNIACDECPVTEINVSPACRGCLATRCVKTCPKDAIDIVDHKAQINHDKCITCGRCLEACPYSAIVKSVRPCEAGCECGAISMGPSRKAKIDYDKCTACGSCVNQCPFGAIMDKSQMLHAIELIQDAKNGGAKLFAAVAPSIAGQFTPASTGQVAAALLALGFSGVYEVAQGADRTAWEESGELLKKDFLTSSCCPAFVAYIEKHYPDMADLISHTPSPMIMTGNLIHEREPGARVVFIGPCIAKKQEVLEKGEGCIDCAITFEELASMLESRNISTETMEPVSLEGASGYGRGFAAGGGVTTAVKRALEERGESSDRLRGSASEGIQNCKVALLKAKRGLLDANFLEGMACRGGCMGGPALIRREVTSKKDLQDYVRDSKTATLAEGAAGNPKHK